MSTVDTRVKNKSGASLSKAFAPFDFSDDLVIFQGQGILVVNKPAGLPTQGTPDKRRDHLYASVYRWWKNKMGSNAYLGLHHRLDRDTSGLVLLTCEREANKWASDVFQNKKLQKTYLAVCKQLNADVELPSEIKNHLKKIQKPVPKMTATFSGGDFAHTQFKLLERRGDKLLVQAEPLTGRMHQIRVHLSEAGFPIFADFLYGGSQKELAYTGSDFPKRVQLHAWKMSVPSPENGEPLTFEAPRPDDFWW